MNLTELGTKYGTDKVKHGYLPIYERFLSTRRMEPLTLLEIGVLGGASLRMWRDYFPNAVILGVDQDPNCAKPEGCTVLQASQQQATMVSMLTEFDIDVVIDDAGHVWAEQVSCLQMVFPLLSSGGLYFVEDLHTSYWQGFGHGESCVGYLKTLVDDVNNHGRTEFPVPPDQREGSARLLKSMFFSRSLCVLERE
jgi:hypothetical protein